MGRLARINEPRRKPRQRRSRETVNTLVEAAAQLFSAEGIAATTNRIAERAGMSIGTLYQYFPDKFALLRAVADRHFRDADRELSAVFAALRTDAPPFDATMRTALEAVVTLHAGRPKLHALLHRLVAPTAEQLDLLTNLEDRLCAEVAFHLRRCGRGGADVGATARMLVHTIDAQLHRVIARDEFDIGDARNALMATVERLAPPPG